MNMLLLFFVQCNTNKTKINTSLPSKAEKTKINTSLPGKTERPRCTELKPFSFELRDKVRYLKKDEKIKDILVQEEKVCF